MNTVYKNIVCFVGKICSGKSYASSIVSKAFHFPIASFSDYLKNYCKNNQIPITRESLQIIGNGLVKETPKEFLKNVIDYKIGDSDSIIIDGIRHKKIMEMVKELSNRPILIYMDADEKIRFKRFLERKETNRELTFEQFLELDRHPVEQEIEVLKKYCDVVFNTSDEYELILNEYLNRRLITLPGSEISEPKN